MLGLASSVSPVAADTILENWQFDDPNGTRLNATANTGTNGSSWNFGGLELKTDH